MDILVCTEKKAVEAWLATLGRSRKHTLTILPPQEAVDNIKKLSGRYLVYLDVSSFQPGEWKKHIRFLVKRDNLRTGIIDPKNSVKDPGALFHTGAVDYINRGVLSEAFQTKRVQTVWDFHPFPDDANHREHSLLEKQDWIPAPGGWKDIRNGKEYSFFFLYIELNMLDEWTKKSGSTHIDDIQAIFQQFIKETFQPYNGKIWMWMKNCGVVLFPFDGSGCPFIEACLRLILNRCITSIEEYNYNSLITYTMAAHLGNTIYRSRGDTGEIISDSINFLFHIGKKFAKKESFYVTENVIPFLSPAVRDLFHEEHAFEGVRMYSSKLPKK